MAKIPPARKDGKKETTGRTKPSEEERSEEIDAQQAHDRNGDVPERDFATEDNGVPRADWNDEGARESAKRAGKPTGGMKARRRPKATSSNE